MKTISVIIVNYNVRDFLEQALLSAGRALQNIPSEIIVVDNASADGSVQMIKERFPEVILIENRQNTGFSAGNNLGLRRASGKFIVLLNPDTVVQEDTFTKLLEFFEKSPEASAATCKILNPDGSFSVDCRHSIPTPLTAFWKLLGLDRLFPKSRFFAKYNMTYLDENELNQVEAISGSFMMMRREIVKKVGELDEDFFMYCEDIDYCHRINQAGGKIFYVPDSQIIHYKGESTKINNLDYVITFNRSLYTFYKKHYQQKYVTPFKWLILLGVIFRGLVIYSKNLIKRYFPLLFDLAILNIVMFLSFYVRFKFKSGFRWGDFFSYHIVVNIISSLLFFLSALFLGIVERKRFSIRKTISATLIAFIFVSALTFFFKQFAFSRLVVVVTAVVSTILMVTWRIVLRYLSRKTSPGHSFFSKRTLIVGCDEESLNLIDKLNDQIDSGIRVMGIVALNKADIGKEFNGIPAVTSIDRLPDFLSMRKTDMVIFPTHNISYETILGTMAHVNRQHIEFKIVPSHLEYMISKSSVEHFQDIPLVDIDYNYGRTFNRFIKRIFDLTLSFLLFIPLLLPGLFLFFLRRKEVSRKMIHKSGRYEQHILWIERKGLLRFFLNLFEILRGRLSFVGAPLTEKNNSQSMLDYKPGLTGIVQQKKGRKQNEKLLEKQEYQYLKNHSLLMDLEILLHAVFSRKQGR